MTDACPHESIKTVGELAVCSICGDTVVLTGRVPFPETVDDQPAEGVALYSTTVECAYCEHVESRVYDSEMEAWTDKTGLYAALKQHVMEKHPQEHQAHEAGHEPE